MNARPLRVGVDARKLLDDYRGIGRYARSLLRCWMRDARDELALTLLVPDLFPGLIAERLHAEIGGQVPVARTGTNSFDLVWYPWNGMTWVARGMKIASVHDCWPFVSPAANEAIKNNEQRPFLTTAANADLIIADSEFGRSEIVRHLGVAREKIAVIPLGVDPPRPAATGTNDRVEAPYLLFVGQAESRKGLGTLLAAIATLPERIRSSYQLVVVGKGQPGADGPAPAGVRAEFLGRVDDVQLDALYAGATAFVFPSWYEGFGLPVLEAMARGAPVIAADAASIPEVAGDAALYFPAYDAAALSQAIARVLEDEALAQRLVAAGHARAAEFTWQRCADATRECFETAIRTTQLAQH
ncbi:MAG: glycosyltransferase family 4 protein [Candidatus Eremiobacteraeota bacterium]|nr:glycosyltransferase family 4 protein [Candidatus Eremiobacteraeota bacterium]MBV8366005.1 glycosyltransferase family 4 protein [Candidatus Eremiobacteraeota bacterium]